MSNNVLSLLGLYKKAGLVVSGINVCKSEIKKNNIYLIIVSNDISVCSFKLFKDMCCYRNIPIVRFATRYDLGKSIGKSMRAVVGIKNKKAAEKILELIIKSRQKNTMGVCT